MNDLNGYDIEDLHVGMSATFSKTITEADIVIMGIIVIGVVAYLFDLLMRWVERRLVPWKGRM